MALKFSTLNRPNMRKLEVGERLTEHGICFERLKNGDGKFTVNIMVDSQRIHRTLGKESEGVTRKQAENFIEKVRTDAREERLNLPKGRKLVLGFKEASKKYLERLEQEGGKDIEKKRQRFKLHLDPFFGTKPLNQIDTFNVNRYKKSRLDHKAAPGTINRELAALSHLFSKAVEWRWLTHKPALIKRLTEDKGRIIYLTTEQCKDLLDAAMKDDNPFCYPFILIGLETSLRRENILSIRIENIDLIKRVIYMSHGKAGAREQPITQNLTDYLKKHLANIPAEQVWLFPSDRAKNGHIPCLRKPIQKVVKAAGLNSDEVTPHTLRHTAITHLVQARVDLPTVQRISGHKTLAMVARYSHQNGAHIRAAMDTLEDRYHSGD